MSHVVTVDVEIRDAEAVHSACHRLALPEPVHGKHRLFSGEVVGLAVELPDWRYPVVCDLSTGQAHYDKSWDELPRRAKTRRRNRIKQWLN